MEAIENQDEQKMIHLADEFKNSFGVGEI